MTAARPIVGVVDYGAGNLVSIEQALRIAGAVPRRVSRPDDVLGVAALIVPGVGAAGPAMRRLARTGLDGVLRRWIAQDRPYLGICLGLQLLFESSDEDGARTLGVIGGRSARLAGAPSLPHIGWNEVLCTRPHPLFEGIPDGAEQYFVHSYAGRPSPGEHDVVLAETVHGESFVSAIALGGLMGVQFHPERSGPDGVRLLANFVGLVSGRAVAA